MRKDIYVVGYSGTGNVVYGKYHTEVARRKNNNPFEDYSAPMTEFQAKRAVSSHRYKGAKIFKLVEVKLKG